MGNDITRAGEKIGWIEGNHIFAHDGKKIGYFAENYVYDVNTQKIARIEGDFLISMGAREARTKLEQVNEEITGGVLPEIGKCAIFVLLD